MHIIGAAVIVALLFVYRTSTTFPDLVIVLIGVPMYAMFRRYTASAPNQKQHTP